MGRFTLLTLPKGQTVRPKVKPHPQDAEALRRRQAANDYRPEIPFHCERRQSRRG